MAKKTSRTTRAISSMKEQPKTSISGINPVSAHPQVPGKRIAAAMRTAYGCSRGIEKKHKETERNIKKLKTSTLLYIYILI